MDCSSGFFLFKKPLCEVKEAVASMYFDECTEDVVVLTADGAVAFYKVSIRTELPEDNVTAPSATQAASIHGDLVYVNTGKHIQIAKRCPLSTRGGAACLVAIVHTDECVHFYLPSKHSSNGAAVTRSSPVEKALATFVCAPRNLRFRNPHYPIRTLYWVTFHNSAAPGVAVGSSSKDELTVENAAQSTFSSSRKYAVVLTQISVDIVSVVEQLFGSETSHIQLVKRITTRVDYWSYSRQARCVVAINELKPSICKPFLVESRHAVVSVLPQFTLDEATAGLCNVGTSQSNGPSFVSPSASALMDASKIQLQVFPVLLYGTLYIAQVTANRSIVLFRYLAPTVKVGAMNAGPPSAAAADVPLSLSPDTNVVNVSFTTPGQSSTAAETSSVASTPDGGFERYAVLDIAFPPNLLCSEMLKVHVLDNLLVVHMTHACKTAFFDIALSQHSISLDPLWGPGAAASSTPAASFAGSAVRFVDPYANNSSIASAASSRAGSPAGSAAPASPKNQSWLGKLTAWSGPSNSINQSTKVLRSSPPVPLGEISPEGPNVCPPLSEMYSFEFYSGRLPVALDRVTQQVRLIGMRGLHVANNIPYVPLRIQFFLNRRSCSPLAVPQLLKSMLLDQEPLPCVAQSLDAICATNFRRAQHRAKGAQAPSKLCCYPSGGPSSETTHVASSVSSKVIPQHQHLLCGVEDEATRKKISSLFACRTGERLVAEEVWGAVLSSPDDMDEPPLSRAQSTTAADTDESVISTPSQSPSRLSRLPRSGGIPLYESDLRPLIDQTTLYRNVFGPLSHKALSLSTATAATHNGGDSPPIRPIMGSGEPSSNRNRYNESIYFANYLLHAILEYTRSLIQHGETLTDSVQRCLVNMFLQSNNPDFFRLHQLLMYRAIDDHVPTALQLITLDAKYPPAFQMGLDMLSRLKASNEIVQVFLARQCPLQAAKYIVANRMEDPPILDVLFCAALLHDEARQLLGLDPLTYLPSSPLRPSRALSPEQSTSPKKGQLTAAGANFYTIYTLLKLHYHGGGKSPRQVEDREPHLDFDCKRMESHRRRYEQICSGLCQ